MSLADGVDPAGKKRADAVAAKISASMRFRDHRSRNSGDLQSHSREKSKKMRKTELGESETGTPITSCWLQMSGELLRVDFRQRCGRIAGSRYSFWRDHAGHFGEDLRIDLEIRGGEIFFQMLK